MTGARWSLEGAEAVLLLRAVIANGDFYAYWRFHVDSEHQRTHTARYQENFDLTERSLISRKLWVFLTLSAAKGPGVSGCGQGMLVRASKRHI
ncbi:hypothetical protein [Streptomyces sp. NBC_01594]|uniref:hypothetical protein n=1 Tax=Streptomyces sp. NBC_01594 TaxID=2975890 RepID=UPI00386A0539